MSDLFKPASNEQSFLKAGLLGFAGAGKTFTASLLAIGLVQRMRELKLPAGNKPAFFLDTESGSDWLQPKFAAAGIELRVAKTRRFIDLLDAVRAAEFQASVLIIDSITAFWREFCDRYLKAKQQRLADRDGGKRTGIVRLEFPDWTFLKAEWQRFTDAFVNGQSHIILCGRAGFEYDFEQDEDGKKELVKTGIKMKAEGEMGYEPSLLVYMERETHPRDLTRSRRVAHVMKDRSDLLDGQQFPNPTFETFRPHVERLNLGAAHVGVHLPSPDEPYEYDLESGEAKWRWKQRHIEIVLAEIEAELVRKWPGQAVADKQAKADCLEKHFGTRAWPAVQAMKLDELWERRDALWMDLRGEHYAGPSPRKQQQRMAPQASAAAEASPPPDPMEALGSSGVIVPAEPRPELALAPESKANGEVQKRPGKHFKEGYGASAKVGDTRQKDGVVQLKTTLGWLPLAEVGQQVMRDVLAQVEPHQQLREALPDAIRSVPA